MKKVKKAKLIAEIELIKEQYNDILIRRKDENKNKNFKIITIAISVLISLSAIGFYIFDLFLPIYNAELTKANIELIYTNIKKENLIRSLDSLTVKFDDAKKDMISFSDSIRKAKDLNDKYSKKLAIVENEILNKTTYLKNIELKFIGTKKALIRYIKYNEVLGLFDGLSSNLYVLEKYDLDQELLSDSSVFKYQFDKLSKEVDKLLLPNSDEIIISFNELKKFIDQHDFYYRITKADKNKKINLDMIEIHLGDVRRFYQDKYDPLNTNDFFKIFK